MSHYLSSILNEILMLVTQRVQGFPAKGQLSPLQARPNNWPAWPFGGRLKVRLSGREALLFTPYGCM